MDAQPIIIVLLTLAAAGGTVAAIATLYTWLRSKDQGYPYESEIEAALLPHLYQAICAAYRTSEMAMDEVQERMDGVDKAAVAGLVYDLLPDTIVIGGRIIPLSLLKQLVPRETFEDWVELAYQRFTLFYDAHQAKFEAAFEEWKEGNKPGPEEVQAIGYQLSRPATAV